jgi:hypothetical protein
VSGHDAISHLSHRILRYKCLHCPHCNKPLHVLSDHSNIGVVRRMQGVDTGRQARCVCESRNAQRKSLGRGNRPPQQQSLMVRAQAFHKVCRGVQCGWAPAASWAPALRPQRPSTQACTLVKEEKFEPPLPSHFHANRNRGLNLVCT